METRAHNAFGRFVAAAGLANLAATLAPREIALGVPFWLAAAGTAGLAAAAWRGIGRGLTRR